MLSEIFNILPPNSVREPAYERTVKVVRTLKFMDKIVCNRGRLHWGIGKFAVFQLTECCAVRLKLKEKKRNQLSRVQ